MKRMDKPIVVMVLSIALQAQTPKAPASTNGTVSKEHRVVCKAKSEIAYAYCWLLDQEFNQARFAKGTYPLGDVLRNPTNLEIPFLAAVSRKAYLKQLASGLTADAKSALQGEANQVAQALSTKAAVPQTGANANSNGSTNLVSKPTTTDLISLAAESGAFTDTVNGTTLTAQANANGLRRYLAGANFSALSPDFSNLSPTTLDILQHLTVAATFDVAQSGTTSATTTGQATTATPSSITSVLLPSNNLTFTSVGTSLTIYRPYTPTSSGFGKAWDAAIVKNESDIVKANKQLYEDYTKVLIPSVITSQKVNEARDLWTGKAAEAETKLDFPEFVSQFDAFVNVIIDELINSNNSFYQDVFNAATDIGQLQTLRGTVLDTARGSLATFKYTYSTPTDKPATHDATAVLGYVWSQHDKGAQLTFNAAGSWFASIPVGAKYGRVKDYQISGEFDQPIGNPSSPRAIFSVAGYGQYQYAANVLKVTVANVVPGTNISVPQNSQVFTSTPGWIGVAQTKLVFNIGKGTSIPIAVKWSNKTDLLTGSDWKGQFGLSYDLSALSSILQEKTK
jgi:hypothetical protein